MCRLATPEWRSCRRCCLRPHSVYAGFAPYSMARDQYPLKHLPPWLCIAPRALPPGLHAHAAGLRSLELYGMAARSVSVAAQASGQAPPGCHGIHPPPPPPCYGGGVSRVSELASGVKAEYTRIVTSRLRFAYSCKLRNGRWTEGGACGGLMVPYNHCFSRFHVGVAQETKSFVYQEPHRSRRPGRESPPTTSAGRTRSSVPWYMVKCLSPDLKWL